MKLLVRHTFACTPERFWEVFWDPAFDERLQQGTAVRRDLLSERIDGSLKFQRYRFTPEKGLPGPVAKLAGTDRLTYEQENRFDSATGVLAWKVFPSLLPDKVTAEGTFRVQPAPQGCERIVDGVIEVRVPFVGSRIEQAIVTDVESGYEAAARVTREFIAERG